MMALAWVAVGVLGIVAVIRYAMTRDRSDDDDEDEVG